MAPLIALDDLKAVAEIAQATATTVAIVVGGLWGYFKFVKGRSFRPRLAVGLQGRWRDVDGRSLLHVRLTVTNVGSSDIVLIKDSSEVSAAIVTVEQGRKRPKPVWPDPVPQAVLTDHQWIESGETVSDDLLFHLGEQRLTTRVEAYLVVRNSGWWQVRERIRRKMRGEEAEKPRSRTSKNVTIKANKILPPECDLDDSEQATSGGADAHSDPGWARAIELFLGPLGEVGRDDTTQGGSSERQPDA